MNLSLNLIVALAISVALLGLQSWRLGRTQDALAGERARFAAFTEQVRVAGERAERVAKEQTAKDKLRLEKANAETQRVRSLSNQRIASLRYDLANRRPYILPPAPSGSSRPDLACFDRTEYQREDGEIISRLREGARRLADEGTTATIDLDVAKRWAQSN